MIKDFWRTPQFVIFAATAIILISTIGGVAALLHWPIDDRPVERLAQEQAS